MFLFAFPSPCRCVPGAVSHPAGPDRHPALLPGAGRGSAHPPGQHRRVELHQPSTGRHRLCQLCGGSGLRGCERWEWAWIVGQIRSSDGFFFCFCVSCVHRCVSSWLSTTMSSSAGASSISRSPSKTRYHGRSVRSLRTSPTHVRDGCQLCVGGFIGVLFDVTLTNISI